jgi:hypothetical protein
MHDIRNEEQTVKKKKRNKKVLKLLTTLVFVLNILKSIIMLQKLFPWDKKQGY